MAGASTAGLELEAEAELSGKLSLEENDITALTGIQQAALNQHKASQMMKNWHDWCLVHTCIIIIDQDADREWIISEKAPWDHCDAVFFCEVRLNVVMTLTKLVFGYYNACSDILLKRPEKIREHAAGMHACL